MPAIRLHFHRVHFEKLKSKIDFTKNDELLLFEVFLNLSIRAF